MKNINPRAIPAQSPQWLLTVTVVIAPGYTPWMARVTTARSERQSFFIINVQQLKKISKYGSNKICHQGEHHSGHALVLLQSEILQHPDLRWHQGRGVWGHGPLARDCGEHHPPLHAGGGLHPEETTIQKRMLITGSLRFFAFNIWFLLSCLYLIIMYAKGWKY